MRKVILLLIIAVFAMSCSSTKNTQTSEKAMLMREYIAEKNYTVVAVSAMPSSVESMQVIELPGEDYIVSVQGDEVNVRLPYYGASRGGTYGTSESFMFKEKVTDYTVDYKKRGNQTVTFTVQTKKDNYRFTISISPSGLASISLRPGNQDAISYSGYLSLDYFDKW